MISTHHSMTLPLQSVWLQNIRKTILQAFGCQVSGTFEVFLQMVLFYFRTSKRYSYDPLHRYALILKIQFDLVFVLFHTSGFFIAVGSKMMQSSCCTLSFRAHRWRCSNQNKNRFYLGNSHLCSKTTMQISQLDQYCIRKSCCMKQLVH